MAPTKRNTGDIVLNKRDAVFGRGRKKDFVRNGSLYRYLIEKYYIPYAEFPNGKIQERRAFVKSKIVDAVLKKGGRFIIRDGPRLTMMHPEDAEDLRLIYKKIQRALFNERKRREEKAEAEELAKAAGFTDLTVPEESPEEAWLTNFAEEETIDIKEEEEEEDGVISVPFKMKKAVPEKANATTSKAAPKSIMLDCLAVYASSLYESSTDTATASEEDSDDDSLEDVHPNFGAVAALTMTTAAKTESSEKLPSPALPFKKRMSRRIHDRAQTRTRAVAATATLKYEDLFKSLCNEEISLNDFGTEFVNLKRARSGDHSWIAAQTEDFETFMDRNVRSDVL